ncbi:tyrosine-type recombinase/integrase [Granulicella sibirica]|uniref:tyrosine-type recombinase/integrase n=1 Tax=Granulicella sibirica TaxID=2479048 RepID=UPI001375813C|nr:site-specific integrase [Granulicella sibirica]
MKSQRAAGEIERAFRTALAKGDVGIVDRQKVPTFGEFSVRFMEAIRVRSAEKPATVRFYADRTTRLLKYRPLREARLDAIDEALIERYVTARRAVVLPASCNRELATLRRALRLAEDWKIITKAPRIRLLKGEHQRTFVLSHQEEARYLAACPPLLRDVASIMLDSGLRIGELLNLRWEDIRFDPTGAARFGSLRVTSGKSRNAQRTLSLTARASRVLFARRKVSKSPFVFPGKSLEAPILVTSLNHLHSKVREPLLQGKRIQEFPAEFVLHGLRHTFLTRLGEAGTDAFTIMRLAGHSSVTVSQRYVHPTPESCETAFERLEALNGRANERLEGKESHQSSHQQFFQTA